MARVLIVGFGNIGRSVYDLLPNYSDMELAGVVTRDPDRVEKANLDCSIFHIDDIAGWKGTHADVAILCGGSKDDLPTQGPFFASHICTVDSFDTHDHIGPYQDKKTGSMQLGYLETMYREALHAGTLSHISTGWDPGTFSIMRAYFQACLAGAKAYAFYGLTEKGGLSMGHSDAIRGIEGVADARSYTHARPEAIARVRSGENPDFAPGEKHWRENLIVLKPDADIEWVLEEISDMPAYFADYETKNTIVSQREIDEQHNSMPHDGLVIAVGPAGTMEFRNTWKSNPAGTAGMLLAYARATVTLHNEGIIGAYTVLDSPIGYLLPADVDPVSLV